MFLKALSAGVAVPCTIFLCFLSRAGSPLPDRSSDGAEGPKPPRAVVLESADDGRQFIFMGFSPDSNILVYSVSHFLGKQQPALVFYDLKRKKTVKSISAPNPVQHPIAPLFLPNGNQLIAGTFGDTKPYLLDWRSGKYSPFECEVGEHAELRWLTLTTKGDLLVTLGASDAPGSPVGFHVWDVATQKKIRRFGAQKGDVIGPFCLGEEGRYLVAEHGRLLESGLGTWTYLNSVKVWDLLEGKEVGLVGKPKQMKFQKGVLPQSLLRDLIGSASRCRVRISPAGTLFVVPMWPRATILEAAVSNEGLLILSELATGNELIRFDDFKDGGGPRNLSMSPDQRILAASGGLMVGTARVALLTWDVSQYQEKVDRLKPQFDNDQLAKLWARLGDKNPVHGYQAMRHFATMPERTVPFLKEKIKVAPDRSGQVRALLSHLSDRQGADKALQRLVEIGEEALPILEKAVLDSPSDGMKKLLADIVASIKKNNDPDMATRRSLWTIELLEFMATGQSLDLLRGLAKGASDSWITKEARLAIRRRRTPY